MFWKKIYKFCCVRALDKRKENFNTEIVKSSQANSTIECMPFSATNCTRKQETVEPLT